MFRRVLCEGDACVAALHAMLLLLSSSWWRRVSCSRDAPFATDFSMRLVPSGGLSVLEESENPYGKYR
jgi:hypothetical protein